MSDLSDKQPDAAKRAAYAAECQRCGACCVYYGEQPFAIPVGGPPLPQPPARFVQIGPRRHYIEMGANTRYMRTTKDPHWPGHHRCACLKGEARVAVSCSIYQARPEACRTYDPGSPDCQRIRAWAGLPSLEQEECTQ